MKITVDGRVVYLGPCKTGAYVYTGEHSQGDDPMTVQATQGIKSWLMIDYSIDGEVVGVEILVPPGD